MGHSVEQGTGETNLSAASIHVNQAVAHELLGAQSAFQDTGMHHPAVANGVHPRAGFEDAGEGVGVGGHRAGEHAEEEEEGVVGGAGADEGADEDVVGLGAEEVGRGAAEDGEGVVEGVGDDEGGRLEEVLYGGRVGGGAAGLDEAGVNLAHVALAPAVLQKERFGVGGVERERRDGDGVGGKRQGCRSHLLLLLVYTLPAFDLQCSAQSPDPDWQNGNIYLDKLGGLTGRTARGSRARRRTIS